MCKLQSLLRNSSNIRVQLKSLPHDDDAHIDTLCSSSPENIITTVGADPSSACLWAMVNDFLEVYTPAACEDAQIASRAGVFLSAGANSSDAILKRAVEEMESIFGESSAQDAVEAKIGSCVAKALKSKSNMVVAESAHNEQALLAVLKCLHREGYDAGLCVTTRKPGHAAGLPTTGGHRYIDVIMDEKLVSGTPLGNRPSEKLIVDVGFSAHFEIARPLLAYQKLIAILPSTFIGKSALLQRVIRIMSQAARVSLESQDMPIPPWRSFTFLLAKWFSSCSRITSVDEAKFFFLNTSSTNHAKSRVLTELNYNTGLVNLADSRVNNDSCESGPKTLEEDAIKAWYPPPPINQIPMNYDNDDASNSCTKKRRQGNVVSALALAFAETQHTHNMSIAASERKVHSSLQQSAAAVSVL